ncbi:cell envelope biogenesis protein TonB [Bacteroidia bacterium]|nr:cell envelope biogenesis protein TonB [Bacteroidia bacterium]
MMKEFTKEEVYGWLGAVVLLLLLLLLLSFAFLTAVPKPEEEAILAVFEEITEVPKVGVSEPKGDLLPESSSAAPDEPVPANSSRPQPAQSPDKPIIAGDEPSPIEVPPPPTAAELAEQKRRAEEEAKRKKEAESRAKINTQVANALAGSKGSGAATASGTARGTDAVGSGAGEGSSSSFNLAGRTGVLQSPVYSAQEEGIILLSITVDPQGNVISASVRSGTTISNAQMRNSAIDAAKRTKFNAINSGGNATGTITYKYKLN